MPNIKIVICEPAVVYWAARRLIMNSLEQVGVKNSGAICDGPSHNHSSVKSP